MTKIIWAKLLEATPDQRRKNRFRAFCRFAKESSNLKFKIEDQTTVDEANTSQNAAIDSNKTSTETGVNFVSYECADCKIYFAAVEGRSTNIDGTVECDACGQKKQVKEGVDMGKEGAAIKVEVPNLAQKVFEPINEQA